MRIGGYKIDREKERAVSERENEWGKGLRAQGVW